MTYYILIIFVFLVTVAPAYPQVDDQMGSQKQKEQEQQKHYLYEWTDSKGIVHITDSLSNVPPKYRSEAQRLETPLGAEGTESQPGEQSTTSHPDYSKEEEILQNQKEEWQNRMKAAKQKLADAERRYQDLSQKRDELLGSWGGPASGHLEGREEAARIEQQLKQVQQEIDDTRQQIRVVIPNEARKAGIPPGWLRE